MKKATLLGAVVVALQVWAGPSLALGATVPTPPCGGSYNPYEYTAADAQACGLNVIPLSGSALLPDGGTRYDYIAGSGAVTHISVPPAGFDPTTATASEIALYNLPPRPADLNQLAAWDTQFAKVKFVPAPSFLVELPNVHADTTSNNWSGYGITGNQNQFNVTGVGYYEPTFGGSRCTTNAEVTWSGIGGWSPSDPLGQDGTAHNVPYMANHQAWYEVYPLEGIIPLSLTASAADYMTDYTSWYTSPDRYGGFVQDLTQNTIINWSQDVASNYYSGDSAEAIAERPTINGGLANLSNFGTMTFIGANADGMTFDQFSGSARHAVDMYNGSTLLALPSGMQSGGNFSDTQHSCN